MINTDVLVTIAFPVYERYEFFEEALNSAINQTIITPIIVVDNGSSHGKFKNYCDKFPSRVKYYRNDFNIGMFANWNKCAELVNSMYLLIIGDDDILKNNFIESFYSAYNQFNNIGVFYTNVTFLNHQKDSKSYSNCNWRNIWGLHSARDLKAKAFEYKLEFPSIACVIKKQLLIDSPFLEQVHAANDKYFIYDLPDETILYGDYNYCFIYRMHESNDSSNKNVVPNLIISHYMIYFKCLDYYKNKNFTKLKIFWQTEYYYFIYKEFFIKILSINSPYKYYFKKMFSVRNYPYILIAALLLVIRQIKHTFLRIK
jgi:hypothetical protein